MKGTKTPSGHNFHQLPAANQIWLHDWGQLADACTVDKCSRKAYVFVDCKQRLKLQGTLILPVGMEQSPSVPRFYLRVCRINQLRKPSHRSLRNTRNRPCPGFFNRMYAFFELDR